MSTKHCLTIILIFATILFTACSSTQYVIYSVNLITPQETVETIPINVNVKILTDNRTNIEDNEVLFVTNSQTVAIEHQIFCINSESNYKKEAVVNQVSQMLAKHFNKAQLFTNASFNDDSESSYYLTGTLNSLYGIQTYSREALEAEREAVAAVGALFGVIGGAIASATISSNFKTPGIIVIEISDLKLFKKDGTLVKDFGIFHKKYKDIFPVNTNCKCIYENVNTKLREFNAELIEKMRTELLEVAF